MMREQHRIDVTEDQMLEYVVRRQDPAVLGPDARTLVTKIQLRAGDTLLVLRPIDPETPAAAPPSGGRAPSS